jgi:SAM-dependent methyltransferase
MSDSEPKRTEEIIDWDSVYRQESEVLAGPAPWNIGEPQPELATLIRQVKFRSDVLDAGCGFAELSLELAAQGYTVMGIDITPTAIAAATAAAAERGLSTATFLQADVTSFSGHDGRFSTVVDSTLFHSLPVERRNDYLNAVHRAAAPGASYFVLVFAKGAFPVELAAKPHEVTQDELRSAVSKYWVVDDIRSAWIHTWPPQFGAPTPETTFPDYELDEKGRPKLAAWLLEGHKPE